MKRFWHSWIAVIVTVAMFSPAVAQNDLGQFSEIGSYQLILSRAGYPTSGYNSVPGGAAAAYASPAATNPPSIGARPYNQEAAVGEIGPAAEPPMAPVASTDPAGDFMSACTTGNCGDPVYSPGQDIGIGGGGGSNYVIGVRGLAFDRDYESHRSVSSNASGARLYTTDADHDAFGGVDVSLTKRNCNNCGWEARYWGLYPDTATASLTGAPVYLTNDWRGLDQIDHIGSGVNVWDIFQVGDVQTVYRETEINNVEFNLLRNGGSFTTRSGRSGFTELMFGFRWFEFDEILGINNDSTFPGDPTTLTYNSEVENTLLGFQVGGRSEIAVNDCWRVNGTTKFGIFNNRINANQSIFDNVGAYSQIGTGPYAGTDYSLYDQKDDLAFLGELDLGLSRQFGAKSRFVVGYRAVAVSGVALADDQTPYDWTDVFQITRTNSDSALLLHGGYAGFEFCR